MLAQFDLLKSCGDTNMTAVRVPSISQRQNALGFQ